MFFVQSALAKGNEGLNRSDLQLIDSTTHIQPAQLTPRSGC
jgi:hypothetical protein